MPSPFPRSTTFVSPVTNLHSGLRRGLLHRRDDRAQRIHRQAFFKNESRAQVERTRAAHGEIVDSAVDGEVADGAAGKNQRVHDERIGGEGKPRAGLTPSSGRTAPSWRCSSMGLPKAGMKNLFDELMSQASAAAVRQDDAIVSDLGDWTTQVEFGHDLPRHFAACDCRLP